MTFQVKTKSSFCAFLIMSNEPNGDDVTENVRLWTMQINIGQLNSKCSRDLISFWINSQFQTSEFPSQQMLGHGSEGESKEANDEKSSLPTVLLSHSWHFRWINGPLVSTTKFSSGFVCSCIGSDCPERPRIPPYIVDIKVWFLLFSQLQLVLINCVELPSKLVNNQIKITYEIGQWCVWFARAIR